MICCHLLFALSMSLDALTLPHFELEPFFGRDNLAVEVVQEQDFNWDSERVLRGERAYSDLATLDLEVEFLRFFCGRFNPDFGRANEIDSSLFGNSISEEYELAEQIGLGVEVDLLHTRLLCQSLSASTFSVDTSALGGWDRFERFRPRRSSDELSSTQIAWNARAEAPFAAWSAHVATVRRSSSSTDERSERAWTASLGRQIRLPLGIELRPLIEVTRRQHADGEDENVRYLTFMLTATLDSLEATLARAERAGDGLDDLLQATLAYRFANGIRIEAGWRLGPDGGARRESFGLLAEYGLAF